jgi:HEAT repeat protein
LFRQALQSLSFELITLAALGAGAAQDAKSVELLASSLSAPSVSTRRAASLALVALGSPSALESVARGLLQGDDDVRRAAAEALANNPKDGYETLRDGATLPDLQVRRAVVYGLARVNESWADEILHTLQVNDSQWIVKTAATEVIEARANPADPRIPRPLEGPSQTPWLIEFAGKQGVGIPPGSAATDILIKALKSGNEVERLGALPYLRRTPTEGVLKEIYSVMQTSDQEMREAAYQFLVEVGATEIPLPSPKQYGFG